MPMTDAVNATRSAVSKRVAAGGEVTDASLLSVLAVPDLLYQG